MALPEVDGYDDTHSPESQERRSLNRLPMRRNLDNTRGTRLRSSTSEIASGLDAPIRRRQMTLEAKVPLVGKLAVVVAAMARLVDLKAFKGRTGNRIDRRGRGGRRGFGREQGELRG